LDISMPEVSGIELVDRLRENNSPVPSVVFVTAYNERALPPLRNMQWTMCSSASRMTASTRHWALRFKEHRANEQRS
jgi:CheY-like chemotaxis protein